MNSLGILCDHDQSRSTIRNPENLQPLYGPGPTSGITFGKINHSAAILRQGTGRMCVWAHFCETCKGRPSVPLSMNFWKISKRPLSIPPPPLLFQKIMLQIFPKIYDQNLSQTKIINNMSIHDHWPNMTKFMTKTYDQNFSLNPKN